MRRSKAIGITVLIMALWYAFFSLPHLHAQAPACDLTGEWQVVVDGQECLRTPFNSPSQTCFPYGDVVPPTFTFTFNPNNGAFRGTAPASEDASRIYTFAGLLVGSNIGTPTNQASWNFPLFKSASCGGAFAGVLSGFFTGSVSSDCTTLNFTLTDPISLVQSGIQGNCTMASAVTITGSVTATRGSAPPPPPPPPPPPMPPSAKMQGPCCSDQGQGCVGNPCDAGSGNKYQAETDYTGAGAFPLRFQRFYNSLVPHRTSIGENWTSSYSQNITLDSSGLSAVVTRPEGKALTFTLQGNVWVPDADVTDRLTQLTDTAGNVTGWQYATSEEDKIEAYNAAGELLSITNRAGLAQTLAYDAQGRLLSVTDPFNRTLTFTYDAANRIATLTDPAGGVYTYSYDAQGNLTSVLYPDGTTRTYQYEDTQFPNALTGITDENGQRFATFAYDANGEVTFSTHAAGADQVILTYNADGTTTVTDALGMARTYDFTTLLGVVKNTSVSAPCNTCGNVSAATTYDANGNVASRTDFNGNVTQYTYDLTRNLETSRVEAFGAPEARTITTEWHPTFRLQVHRAEPLRITTNVYDDTGSTCGARGALCSLTLQATTDPTGVQGFNAPLTGIPRIWTFTYNANGQVLTVDGPRSTVQDITTDTYDPQGNLASVTNALGQVTQVPQYDTHGKPLTILDPNGLVATLAYDARQRVISRTIGTETTSFTYDGVGQLTKVTLPDGSFLAYAYDAAHRLIAIQDSAGDKVAYTLDAMGNRVEEDVSDPQGTLTQTRARVYDSLNRLVQAIGAQSQATQYAYDPQGNRTSVTDPLNQTTLSAYDALNRLVSLTDPANGTTSYAYPYNADFGHIFSHN
jgi:YD repeat-containing protein